MGKKGVILLVCTICTVCAVLGAIGLKGSEVQAKDGESAISSVISGIVPMQIKADIATITQKVIANRPATVVIDAGHGGNQPGCVVGKILEKDVNLSISLILKEELESRGIRVILTRADDTDVKLANRTVHAKSLFADYFVSIHCNAYVQDRSVRGFQCFYYQSEMGRILSDEITEMAKQQIKIRRAQEASYQVLRESAIPATLIELGYLTNYRDRTALISGEYQRQMAAAIAEGINKVLQG